MICFTVFTISDCRIVSLCSCEKLNGELRDSREKQTADHNWDDHIQKLIGTHEIEVKDLQDQNARLSSEINDLNERLNREVIASRKNLLEF